MNIGKESERLIMSRFVSPREALHIFADNESTVIFDKSTLGPFCQN